MRIGVSGAGSIGRRHIRLLRELGGFEVHVYDAAPDGELDAGVLRHGSLDALLGAGLDGLIVATPDEFHAPQAAASCRAGVPVLVEKPVAETVASAAELAATARASGVPVLVGYVLRHYDVMRHAKELIDTAQLGQVLSFHLMLGAYETLEVARSRFGQDRPYRLPFDYSHEWDYLQWFLGPVHAVSAAARTGGDLPLRQRPNVIDAVLELDSGPTGTAHLDYVQTGGVRQLVLIGDRATLHVDVSRGEALLRPRSAAPQRVTFPVDRDLAFIRQLRHFETVIRRTEPPCVDVDTATRALEVAEAVVQAAESRTRVQLDRLRRP